MILNDDWIEGLNQKQQNIVKDYVLSQGKISDMEMHGYKSRTAIKKFLDSEKGRKAVKRFIEHKFDVKKDIVKAQLMQMHFTRAFFNPADIITPTGALVNIEGKPIQTLKQLGKLAFCIEGIESEIIGTDKMGKPISKVKIKLCDRNKSLEKVKELFRIGEDDDEDYDEQSIFEMSDEEREEEIKKLLKQDPKLIEFVKGDEDV